MSKISKDGFEQIQVIKNALDSMYDKLDRIVYVPKGKTPKNIDGNHNSINLFKEVSSEFEAISGIVELSGTWEEVE